MESIAEDELLLMQRKEFSPDYHQSVYANSDAKLKETKVKFDEGSHANKVGDYFSLAGLYYALRLFFEGIGLVFKKGLRRWVFSVGSFIFEGTAIYMCMLEWACFIHHPYAPQRRQRPCSLRALRLMRLFRLLRLTRYRKAVRRYRHAIIMSCARSRCCSAPPLRSPACVPGLSQRRKEARGRARGS